jgi:hypothetical protein
VSRAARWLPLVFVVLASEACGAERWFFDEDSGAEATDATPPAVDASDGDGAPPADAGQEATSAEAAEASPEASSAPDAVPACTVDGDCPAATPVCRPSSGLCIRCASDNDCTDAAPAPACDMTTGRCVACTSDVQCAAATPRCNPASLSCVRCLSSADCGRESACELATHTCTPMI